MLKFLAGDGWRFNIFLIFRAYLMMALGEHIFRVVETVKFRGSKRNILKKESKEKRI